MGSTRDVSYLAWPAERAIIVPCPTSLCFGSFSCCRQEIRPGLAYAFFLHLRFTVSKVHSKMQTKLVSTFETLFRRMGSLVDHRSRYASMNPNNSASYAGSRLSTAPPPCTALLIQMSIHAESKYVNTTSRVTLYCGNHAKSRRVSCPPFFTALPHL